MDEKLLEKKIRSRVSIEVVILLSSSSSSNSRELIEEAVRESRINITEEKISSAQTLWAPYNF